MKQIWTFINELLGKDKKNTVKSIKDENSTELIDTDMANYFNSFILII